MKRFLRVALEFAGITILIVAMSALIIWLLVKAAEKVA